MANSSKVEGLELLTDRYALLSYQCQTEDEIDAMVIGLYGQMRSNGGVLPPEPRRKRSTRKAI